MSAEVAAGRADAPGIFGARPARRLTGPLPGGLRFARVCWLCLEGAVRIEIAYRLGGCERAASSWRKVAGELRGLFGITVEAAGKLEPEAHEVRVANHSSYLDILVLTEAGAGRFLSRHDVAGWPLVGRVAERIGTVFVNRDTHEGRLAGLRALADAAKSGPALLVFPEGRTNERGVLPFERGAFSAAKSARVPIRPVAVLYEDRAAVAWVGDMTLLPHVWRRLQGDVVHCVVRALPRIQPNQRSSAEVAEEARAAIARALASADPC